MSNWFSVSLQAVSQDKRSAVFVVENATLEPQRVQAVAAATEMAGAAPHDDAFFLVEPSIFGLEPAEKRDITISLSDKAPKDGKLAVRLRVEKADRPDDFVHGPGVELGTDPTPRKGIPPWVWFAIGGGVIATIVIGILVWKGLQPDCESNADCTNGFQCTRGECKCGPATKCDKTTPQCHNGQCKPNCNQTPCGQGEYCNQPLKVCRPGCEEDADCEKGYICGNHQCRCGTMGRCSDKAVCFEHQCRLRCGSEEECAKGQHCETDAGACVPGCKTAANCEDGFTCKNGECKCGTKFKCLSTQVCYANECRRKCDPGKKCPLKYYCNDDNACMLRCDAGGTCPPAFKCDATTGKCKCDSLICRIKDHKVGTVPIGTAIGTAPGVGTILHPTPPPPPHP